MPHSYLYIFVLHIIVYIEIARPNEDAKRLLDDLFSDYDPVVRPVKNPEDTIKLSIGLKLSQIADIVRRHFFVLLEYLISVLKQQFYFLFDKDEKNQIMCLKPNRFMKLIFPYLISADGDYQITTKTKATIHYDGKIIWEPPMIYKSYCAINIEYYPFDIQDCYMKFGTWTFDGSLIDLEHININNSIMEKNPNGTKKYTVVTGIDMSDYYQSVEWDVLSIPAQKNVKVYDCCPEPYHDIFFNITIRRKTLFYTVNLIIPCVNISFLSVLVFYLPSDSGEKLTLGISILVALLVFYLLLIELIPPTSLVIPLLGKYLLFTLILVNLSILLTIFILNLHHRKPSTHKMPFWMKRVILDILPKLLMIERPVQNNSNVEKNRFKILMPCIKRSFFSSSLKKNEENDEESTKNLRKTASFRSLNQDSTEASKSHYPKNIVDALNGIEYINSQMKIESDEAREIDDWKYASMVIDRLLLWIFTAACLMGTFGILLQAPSIYDQREELKKIENQT